MEKIDYLKIIFGLLIILIPLVYMVHIEYNKDFESEKYCKDLGFNSYKDTVGNGYDYICYNISPSSNNCIYENSYGGCLLYADNFKRIRKLEEK